MNTFMLTDPQLRTLIDILKDNCENTGWGDIDYTDADHMEFLAMRAGILKILDAS
jgi:hypothetical protein